MVSQACIAARTNSNLTGKGKQEKKIREKLVIFTELENTQLWGIQKNKTKQSLLCDNSTQNDSELNTNHSADKRDLQRLTLETE